MSKSDKKVLFAAGGTGGHLFPAQALAEQLSASAIEVFFAGAQLSSNKYFNKTQFAHQDICSMTPFRGGPFKALQSLGTLFQGIWKSLKLLNMQKPDVVVGFGSFHAFPVLCAAAIKRIPIVLFESNAIPGKVVRLFSKRALFTGIFFSDAHNYLKGKTVEVDIPKKQMQSAVSKQEARRQFDLDPERLTLLIFGGSQGAKKINQHVLDLVPLLHQKNLPFQLIHFTGNEETAKEMSALCERLSIPCYIKPFEPKMPIAWSAADIAICRAGAMTLSELLHYEVPGILIPYPFAADQHQLKNALFLEKKVGGATHLLEELLSAEKLADSLLPLCASDSKRAEQMKKAIQNFKVEQKKANLSDLILNILKR